MNKASKVSKYRSLGLVGQGQFGRVFCGCHRRTGGVVALKDLDRHRFPTHQFLRELRFLLELAHPNIVTCKALEHTRTGRYLVMDYCEGGTLRTLMEEGALSLSQGLKLVGDVLQGLEHAHSHGIVHCDIKPENILLQVSPGGWIARISDFGIARFTQDLVKGAGNTGSPAYMAPERFYGQYSVASDLYAVGVMLFELWAGYRPFSGPPLDLMTAHLNQPAIAPADMPPGLQAVVLKALQKLPARRFKSAAVMGEALQAVQRDLRESQLSPQHQFAKNADYPLSGWRSLRRERLEVPITSLVSLSQSSGDGIYGGTEAGMLLCRFYPQGALRVVEHQKPLTWSFPIKARVQRVLVRPQGCFVITDTSVMLLNWEPSSAPLATAIAQFETNVTLDLDSKGWWLAALTQDLRVQILNLGLRRLATSQPIPLKSRVQHLLILDSRHFATLALEKSGTRLEVWTRRGTLVGTWLIKVQVERLIPTRKAYRFLATERGNPHAVLCLDLKPFRIRRMEVAIADPTLLVATTWGYVVGNPAGQMMLLDEDGVKVGRIDVPQEQEAVQLKAIAPVGMTGLMVATQVGDQGYLDTLNLKDLDVDLVF